MGLTQRSDGPVPVGTSIAAAQVWAMSSESVARAQDVDPARGLDQAEVARRRARFGANALRTAARRGARSILRDQLRSFIVALLAVGAALSFAFGEVPEGVAIVLVILINTLLGFVTELRAVRSMEALRRLGQVRATVRRDGRAQHVAAEDLVPGDVVLLEAGDVVTADVRLVEASRLAVNESELTGESVPVAKSVAAVAADAPLGERRGMLYKGTALTRGAGVGIVVSTGMATELGRITALVEEVDVEDTPLERRLDRLGRALAGASLAFVVAIAVVGIATGRDVVFVIQTAIALAVASVPEGLPIVATIALARGMWRMARCKARIEALPAVETLGSTSVILTDKTGTLTENRMSVVRVVLEDAGYDVNGAALGTSGAFARDGRETAPGGEPILRALLEHAALCTDAAIELGQGGVATGLGDPMEVALLVAAEKARIGVDALRRRLPEVREEAFDPELRLMATVHRLDAGFRVAVKGAPEAVLAHATGVRTAGGVLALDEAARARWRERAEALGADGLRVLAVATKDVTQADAPVYGDLELLGLVGLLDAARSSVRAAIDASRAAGIRVVMVTGDQASTAAHVARSVGLLVGDDAGMIVEGARLRAPGELSAQERVALLRATIVARTSPEQKLHLLALHREAGETVAMIGDGVNDAPALRAADIGIAMGRRGTQVACEAAAMVLEDDDLATVNVAIEQGRVIFANIRKFVVYLVSCNLSEILTIGLATLVHAPLPILPLQILFLNLVTDVFPALALGVGEGAEDTMRRPPRVASEPLLTWAHWRWIVGHALLLSLPVIAGLAIAHEVLDLSHERAVTISFLVLAFGQLAHVFNAADRDARVLDNEVVRNPWVWAATAFCVALIVVGVYLPVVSDVLSLHAPGPSGWLVVLGGSACPVVVGRLYAAMTARRK